MRTHPTDLDVGHGVRQELKFDACFCPRAVTVVRRNREVTHVPSKRGCPPSDSGSMARTKLSRVLLDHLERQQTAALADRAARSRVRVLKVTRVPLSREAAQLRVKESCARSQERTRRSRQWTRNWRADAQTRCAHTPHARRRASPHTAYCMHLVHARMCAQACCSCVLHAPRVAVKMLQSSERAWLESRSRRPREKCGSLAFLRRCQDCG